MITEKYKQEIKKEFDKFISKIQLKYNLADYEVLDILNEEVKGEYKEKC